MKRYEDDEVTSTNPMEIATRSESLSHNQNPSTLSSPSSAAPAPTPTTAPVPAASSSWEVLDIIMASLVGFVAIMLTVSLVLDNMPFNHTSAVHVYDHYLSPNLCHQIIHAAENHGKEKGWQTKRHRNYPTTDFPLYELRHNITLPAGFQGLAQDQEIDFVTWLNHSVIDKTIFPLLRHHYNIIPVDTESPTPFFSRLTPIVADLEMRDLFLVKYDAFHEFAQRQLEMHVDSSLLSFIITLSQPLDNISDPKTAWKEGEITAFRGGGTRFYYSSEVISPPPGGIAFFPSRLYHEGLPVIEGIRYIIVGFVNVFLDRPGGEFLYRFGRLGRCIEVMRHSSPLSMPFDAQDKSDDLSLRGKHCISAWDIYGYEVERVLTDLLFIQPNESVDTVWIK